MCYQVALTTECLITHITSIRAFTPVYVLMCYQIALFTECLITYFTGKWMLTPMYITGISAFSTVYVKLFIQSTLVKTQKINILIERTIIFMGLYTGCHRRKGPNFGRVFLMLNYTDITQNTYIQS